MKAFGWLGRGTGTRADPARRSAKQLRDEAASALLDLRGEPRSTSSEIASAIVRAIAAAQDLASVTPRPGYALLAGAHLVAAAATRVRSPSEAEARSIGHAAVALKLGARPESADATDLETVVEERFKMARGRIRGSIYAPRDVEYAFSGQIDGLRPAATSAERRPAVERLIRDGVREALVAKGEVHFEWSSDDLMFIDALTTAARRPHARD